MKKKYFEFKDCYGGSVRVPIVNGRKMWLDSELKEARGKWELCGDPRAYTEIPKRRDSKCN